MGYVKGQVTATNPGKHDAVDDLIGSFNQFGLDTDGVGGGGLDAIVEGSEDEDSDDEGGVPFDKEASKPHQGVYEDFDERHFPQAFSHYTYEKSKRNLIVVDLQGVFEKADNGSSLYVLTDPVIHKQQRRKTRRHESKRRFDAFTFGRTDRHEKGIKAFFETHVCTDVCRLLGLTENL